MPHAKTRRRKAGWAKLCLLALSATTCWAEPSAVLISGERLASTELVAYDSKQNPRGATLSVEGANREAEGLVRWGEPAPAKPRAALVLANGSRVLSDRTWSPAGLVPVEEERVRLRRGGGWFDVARESVRWVVLDPAKGDFSIDSLPDGDPRNADEVWLASGDRLTGRVRSLMSLEIEGGTDATPLAGVTAVRFASPAAQRTQPACLVGLTDGSLIHADRASVAKGRYRVEVLGAKLTGQADQVAFIQPLGGSLRYLSDLEPVDYQHTPYLDLAWPYARDRGLRGRALAGGGARRAKGLAMHSAARLIYQLDGSNQRFRADLAVGDPPEGSAARGSVVFRVYLVLDGAFAPAYESPTIRAGDEPTPIDLDATGAAAIALVVDYADGGDAGDEALWLDARLVATE